MMQHSLSERHEPHRRKWVWFCLVGLVVLGGVSVVASWWARRTQAFEVMEREAAAGLRVKWRTGDKVSSAMPMTFVERYSPWTRPVDVAIDYKMVEPGRLGAALKHFGGFEELSFGQGEVESALKVFEAMGAATSLKELYLFNVMTFGDREEVLDARLLPVLARMRSLEVLTVVPSGLSGEGFPLLPEIRNIDLAYSPITDAGLARLLKCPKLMVLSVRGERISRAGILDAVAGASATVREVRIRGTKFSVEEMDEIEGEARRLAPLVEVAVRH